MRIRGRTANSLHSGQKIIVALVLLTPMAALFWILLEPPQWLLFWPTVILSPMLLYFGFRLLTFNHTIQATNSEFLVDSIAVEYAAIQAITERLTVLDSISLRSAFPTVNPFRLLSNHYFRVREFTVVSTQRDISFGYLEAETKLEQFAFEPEYLSSRAPMQIEHIRVFPNRKIVLGKKEEVRMVLDILREKTGQRPEPLSG